MKAGLLGSGDVGRSLGRGFVRHGHEAMCIAWTYYGFERGGWDHAFKMLHR